MRFIETRAVDVTLQFSSLRHRIVTAGTRRLLQHNPPDSRLQDRNVEVDQQRDMQTSGS